MNRDLNDYNLYVFDLDGTLYDQPRLRLTMAIRLLKYYICHPFKITELMILQKFRAVKDKWNDAMASEARLGAGLDKSGLDSLDTIICGYIAKKNNIEHELVCNVVKRWIYDNPLTALYEARDSKLISFINTLRDNGKIVVVWSDYPVVDKLNALKVTVDGIYCSTDKDIAELKPSPKGLLTVIGDYKVKKDDVIMIGDRLSKDGQAAINAGVDYLILEKNIKNRNSFANK